jgi:hypothetical protein
MTELAAAVTMVKDDYFYLERWIDYYGRMFGRERLYILSHGGDPGVRERGEGCNVIRVPGEYEADFNVKRAAILTSFCAGLRAWYRYIVCTDVDEFVVVDPKTGMDLAGFLSKRRRQAVITPIGLEVIHRPSLEPEPIDGSILAVRRYCRYSSFYCKPCVIGAEATISRGGHYSSYPELRMFRSLYLFHMKYCDREMSIAMMRRRAATIQAIVDDSGDERPSLRPTQWNKTAGKEEARFDALAALPVKGEFDFSDVTADMEASWAPRGHGLYHFRRLEGEELYVIPERFGGIV